jgi:lipid-binding SYLF domain-containing protein
MNPITRTALILVLAVGWLVGGTTVASTRESGDVLLEESAAALRDMDRANPGVEALARRGYGYAVFPEVVKAGLGFGGAYGQGVVYEQGQHVGYVDLMAASVGLQLGGQTYSELIVFEDKAALDRFKEGRLDFTADASAIILMTGTAVTARFVHGVAVIVQPLTGAMAEAAIGGQQFRYVPK